MSVIDLAFGAQGCGKESVVAASDSASAPVINSKLRCPSCSASVNGTIYRVSSIPIHSCILLDSAEEARAFPRRDLELAFCTSCGFVFNRIFDESVMFYSSNFEESQHFSDTFNAFAKNLARSAAQKCAVGGKYVVEIGCGKGEFLRELCSVGGARGLGIDPAYRVDEGRSSNDSNVQFIADLYSDKYEHIDANVIVCRHTLEHIAPVARFVQSIRKMAGERRDTHVFFETPDAKRVLAEGAFWDIYYEHCSYFSPGAHARLFRRQGFDVTELSLLYDQQYIVQYARPDGCESAPRFELERDLPEMHELAECFPAKVQEIQRYWRNRIRSAWNGGARIVLWGGGSKAVSFVTTLGLTEEIAAAVDINPYKQGKFIPGTGHPVIAPQALLKQPPDLVVVMNPIYVPEIKKGLEKMGLAPEIIALAPTVLSSGARSARE
jgi:SAM-dependent methyltransferase